MRTLSVLLLMSVAPLCASEAPSSRLQSIKDAAQRVVTLDGRVSVENAKFVGAVVVAFKTAELAHWGTVQLADKAGLRDRLYYDVTDADGNETGERRARAYGFAALLANDPTVSAPQLVTHDELNAQLDGVRDVQDRMAITLGFGNNIHMLRGEELAENIEYLKAGLVEAAEDEELTEEQLAHNAGIQEEIERISDVTAWDPNMTLAQLAEVSGGHVCTGVTEEAVNGLIDARSFATEESVETLRAELASAGLSEDQVKQVVADAIAEGNFATAESVETLSSKLDANTVKDAEDVGRLEEKINKQGNLLEAINTNLQSMLSKSEASDSGAGASE